MNGELLGWMLKAIDYEIVEVKVSNGLVKIQTVSNCLDIGALEDVIETKCILKESLDYQQLYLSDIVQFSIEFESLFHSSPANACKILHAFAEPMGYLEIDLINNPTYYQIIKVLIGLGKCSLDDLIVEPEVIIIQ